MPDAVKLAGTMSDLNGLRIKVYQDHDGVRLDIAGVEIMLDQDGQRDLRELLISASVDARFWSFHG